MGRKRMGKKEKEEEGKMRMITWKMDRKRKGKKKRNKKEEDNK